MRNTKGQGSRTNQRGSQSRSSSSSTRKQSNRPAQRSSARFNDDTYAYDAYDMDDSDINPSSTGSTYSQNANFSRARRSQIPANQWSDLDQGFETSAQSPYASDFENFNDAGFQDFEDEYALSADEDFDYVEMEDDSDFSNAYDQDWSEEEEWDEEFQPSHRSFQRSTPRGQQFYGTQGYNAPQYAHFEPGYMDQNFGYGPQQGFNNPRFAPTYGNPNFVNPNFGYPTHGSSSRRPIRGSRFSQQNFGSSRFAPTYGYSNSNFGSSSINAPRLKGNQQFFSHSPSQFQGRGSRSNFGSSSSIRSSRAPFHTGKSRSRGNW